VRSRLALRQALGFGLLLTLLACAAYVLTARRAYDLVDEILGDRSAAVRSMLQLRDGAVQWLNDKADPEVRDRFSRSRHYYQLIDTQGRIVDSSRQAALIQMPVTAAAGQSLTSGHPVWETITTTGGVRLRVVDSPVLGERPQQTYVLRVGITLQDTDEYLRRVAALLLVLVPVVTLFAGITTWVATGGALGRIDHIKAAANQIALPDLNHRFPIAGTGDELEQLSTTLNAMVSRLQSGFERMHEFLPNVSHELRRSLTVLRAETERALRWSSSEEDYRKVLSNQLEQLELTARTVSDLLLLAQAESGRAPLHRQTENLSELVTTAVDSMRGTALERGVEVCSTVQENVVGQVDAGQIWRLLLNLIENAIKFNRPSGRVEVVLTAQSHLATLSVTDNGCGIAPQDVDRIFERFYRAASAAQSSIQGMGLGLCFVRSIAEAHGGHIEVTSTPGEGSCFRVWLPLVPAGYPVSYGALAASRTSAIN
jgi:signal transduction histidine kinase